MLFYSKKHPLLELAVVLLLGGGGAIGIALTGIAAPIEPTLGAFLSGVLGSLGLAAWTLGVQGGYAIAKGRAHARRLTTSLAQYFAEATLVQMSLGLVAAAAEELFFRGFIQGSIERALASPTWGVVAGGMVFMGAHIGGRDIRVIGYWSIFQGLGLGLMYAWSGNLLVPMLAHGLFDMGAMVYFKWLMGRPLTDAARAA